MLLKQLKQFTLSATRRKSVFKTDVKQLTRFYGAPAVCKSLTTSKVYKRLSREERRTLVESFVDAYRAANAGRFPTLEAIHKGVGGNHYVVRGIFQELKLKPKAHAPIIAKALSEVSPSVSDDASSHFSQAGSVEIRKGSEQRQNILDSSHSNSDGETNLQGSNIVITATDEKRETETTQSIEVESCFKNSGTKEGRNLTHLGNQESKADHLEGAAISAEVDACLENSGTKEEGNSTHFGNQESKADHLEGISAEVEACLENSGTKEEGNLTHLGNQESKADHLEGISAEVDACLKNSGTKEEGNLTHLGNQESKADHLEGISAEVEACLNNSATREEGNLTHLGNQESKADHLEGAAISADVVTTETRQVSERVDGEVKETRASEVKEKSSPWSNIMSFAKGFANFWRKG